MTIGELAKRCHVNVQTVRYYERLGLLPKAIRTASNYRIYSRDTLQQLRFIKCAQGLGFSLGEVKELMSLRSAATTQCAEVQRRAKAKIKQIDKKVRTLLDMRKALSHLIVECFKGGSATECPFLEGLDCEKEMGSTLEVAKVDNAEGVVNRA